MTEPQIAISEIKLLMELIETQLKKGAFGAEDMYITGALFNKLKTVYDYHNNRLAKLTEEVETESKKVKEEVENISLKDGEDANKTD
tara:strand:- start:38 stop:298 length:261 start_codon:yes stop_codon:yes gene_type:complete